MSIGLGVVALAFNLRVFRLADHNVWYDEAFTLGIARLGPVGAALRTAADTHPPLYYWLLGLWEPLTGAEPFGLRFLTVLLSVPAVAVVASLGRRAFGPAGGLWAALFLGLNPLHIRWSQEVRMHAPAVTFGLVGLYFGLRWLTDVKPRRLHLAAYAAGLVAAAFTLYPAAALPLLSGLWLRREGRGRAWLLATLGTSGLLGPWVGFALSRQQSWSAGPPTPLPELLRALPAGLLLGRGGPDNLWPLAAAALAACLLGSLGHPAGRRFGAGFLLTAGLGVLVLLPRPLGYVPVYDPRYFLPAVPLLGLGLASAASARPRPLALGLGLGLLGLLLLGTWQYLEGRRLTDDYITLFRVLRAYASPGDRVILVSGDRLPIFEYYARRAGLGGLEVLPASPRTDPAWRAAVDGLASGSGRIWLVLMEPAIGDPGGEVQARLKTRLPETARFMFGHNGAVLFDPAGRPPRPARLEPEVRVDGPAGLFGYDPPVRRAEPGDRVYLVIYRRLGGEGARVELTDPAGRVRQVWELGSSGEPGPELVSLMVSPGLPPGGYTWAFRAGDRVLALGGLAVEQTAPPPPPAAPPTRPLGVAFQDGIVLAGADLPAGPLAPAGGLRVRLYWSVAGKPTEDWQVFVHLVPAPGEVPVTQADFRPAGGLLPTYQWAPGDRFADEAVIGLPREVPPGDYYLVAGLYRLSDGRRNFTAGGESFAVLGRVVVGGG